MGFKRRRLSSKASSSKASSQRSTSSRQQSSRPQPFARLSSATQNSVPCTTPSLPDLPQQSRLSLRLSGGQLSSRRPSNEDVIPVESEAEILAREDADEMNEIILAIDMREKDIVGCSYYIAREEKLYVMQDIKMAGLDVINTLKFRAQPTLILISTRSDEKLEENLSKEARGIDKGDEASTLHMSRLTC